MRREVADAPVRFKGSAPNLTDTGVHRQAVRMRAELSKPHEWPYYAVGQESERLCAEDGPVAFAFGQ